MTIFSARRKRSWRQKVTVPSTRNRLILTVAMFLCAGLAAFAQDWVRTGTGLGVEKPRLAVADFAARSDPAKNHSALFTQVVRDDLQFSGILELVSPSFYPQQVPSVPAELKNLAWTEQPVTANNVAFGNLRRPRQRS